MQLHGEKKRKIEDQSQKTGEERLSIKQWGIHEKKQLVSKTKVKKLRRCNQLLCCVPLAYSLAPL